MNRLASTTVTIVSRVARSDKVVPSRSSNRNVAATGIGSEMPVDSNRR